ncbi:biliverdin-producing heme oxygenase [Rhizobium sp. P38BS-XIX]|uniref:biliverdin-producing heme oxygenase n=1 Tax=Rhizobium sp. P38BS-XIX TaxID=2726740 RepID=UPI001456D5AD|nr:biliverdin-producing heme oxygenase [Rhizobium sp. P38BS-XIX]NLS00419.1 biliverdin-producing heme oxygenase [Rhizobium sp. P38BS-XIX]
MFQSRDAYRKYLAATLVSRGLLEAKLEAGGVENLVPDWGDRKIISQLRKDIADLSDEPMDDEIPVETAEAALDLSDMIGTLYVLEGSGLGATILAKKAAELDLSAEFGARHLATQVGNLRSWHEILKLIDTTPIEDEERCIAAAISTFGVFEENYEKVFGNVSRRTS